MASLTRDTFDGKVPADLTLSIVVLGASGDLAKKKTFPALYALYAQGWVFFVRGGALRQELACAQ
jgi:hypothetical protein